MKQQASQNAARSHLRCLKRPQPPDHKFVLARLKKLITELKARVEEPRST
ncbi:MAG: hypothetical protein H0W33_05245 [Gammaproteobacteria bacterium]|nr:hypothetical protein [Gammaproteobacteria bacterium]